MQRLYQPTNFLSMDADQKKELLHLRIEQANEQMLDALAELAEVLFKNWQPEVMSQVPSEPDIDYSSLTRMTSEEMRAELEAGVAEYERGEYLTAAESKAEAAS